MNPIPTFKVLRYRGSTSYEVRWIEAGQDRLQLFEKEDDAKEFIATLSASAVAGTPQPSAPAAASPAPVRQAPEAQPLPELPPYASEDAPSPEQIAFATAKLRLIGKDLRFVMTEYSYAHKLLEKSGLTVLDAVRQLVDASIELQDTGVDFSTAIFEYVEARRQTDGVPLSDVVRQYKRLLKQAANAPEPKEVPAPEVRPAAIAQVKPADQAQPAVPAKPAASTGAGSKPTITVAKLLDLFLVLKTKSGTDAEEVADIKLRLGRLAGACPGQASHDLFFGNDAWFNQLEISEPSRQKLRALARELGQFALQSGFRL
ncbi:MAG: hypothetical protein EAZ36_00985 [Verrucomicrobia bacterium]|nr:MAG: hypothetical protein EAZ36_00985 [Verrucomicrobiota bacterium]